MIFNLVLVQSNRCWSSGHLVCPLQIPSLYLYTVVRSAPPADQPSMNEMVLVNWILLGWRAVDLLLAVSLIMADWSGLTSETIHRCGFYFLFNFTLTADVTRLSSVLSFVFHTCHSSIVHCTRTVILP